jgi:putative endonuclease
MHLFGRRPICDPPRVAKTFFVYMLASRKNGTLYVGVTSNLVGRLWQHRNHVVRGFSDRYGVTRLVWWEMHDGAETAIRREKQIKKWRRAWKVQLLSAENPEWDDLAPALFSRWGGGAVDEDGFPLPRE